MEDLRSVLIKGSKGFVEDDEIYDVIEAPRFVDFTVPDRSRADDSSWFCVQIGCDQQHEQVDPEALHRSFKLRVMAARSPNPRLRKAVNGDDGRSIRKYPQSAPAKPLRDRITKLSTITAANQEKIVKTRLKDHPITSLRSTPNCSKAKLQYLTSEKALTTPRNKKYSSKQELFQSVKYQKAPFQVPKDRSVAKALVFHTPKKKLESSTITSTPISEVCAEMKQLKIGCLNKATPRGRICNSSRCEGSKKGESAMSLKKKSEGHTMLQERVINGELSSVSISNTNVEELPSRDSLQSLIPDSRGPSNSNAPRSSEDNVENVSFGSTETANMEDATESEDNKENVPKDYNNRDMNSNTTISESDLQSDNSENLIQPLKVINAPSRTFKKNLGQGVKNKRTTNPKPFRLRTEERGILREANVERRLQPEAHPETASAPRCGDGIQNGSKTTRPKQARFVEHKVVASRYMCQKSENLKEENVGEKSPNKAVKVASTRLRLKAPSVMADKSNTANAKCLVGKTFATIPKGPNFHKIHTPKGCTKRPGMAIS